MNILKNYVIMIIMNILELLRTEYLRVQVYKSIMYEYPRVVPQDLSHSVLEVVRVSIQQLFCHVKKA